MEENLKRKCFYFQTLECKQNFEFHVKNGAYTAVNEILTFNIPKDKGENNDHPFISMRSISQRSQLTKLGTWRVISAYMWSFIK